MRFQSTLPQGKWRYLKKKKVDVKEFQSTLPQEKWPYINAKLLHIHAISIHTSAREVTTCSFHRHINYGISIHTSAREVTWLHNAFTTFTQFQSTLPQEKWLDGQQYIADRVVISIHTSAREVTDKECLKRYRANNFNPHFRKGSDVPVVALSSGYLNFNPHFRKGSDASDVDRLLGTNDFNPHFRKGSDKGSAAGSWTWYRFQSTLPQGKWLIH